MTSIAHDCDSFRCHVVAIAVALGLGVLALRPAPDSQIVERIEIHGNSRTRDKVIRHVLHVFEGGTLQREDPIRLRRRVESLGYFTQVAVQVRPGSSSGLMRIDIYVIEPPAKATGFSSTDNFIAECTMRQKAP